MIDPEKYESNKDGPNRDNDEFLPRLINLMSWREGDKVLDYGCGAGSTGYNHILPRLLHYPDSQMYSVDVSSRMVDFAEKHYPHDRIVYKVGNIMEGLPFAGMKFDKIFSIYVFHFIHDITKALQGFYDILVFGGQLGFTSLTISSWIVQTWQILGESNAWKEYMHGYQKFMPEWSAYKQGKGAEHFRELLEGCGFHVKCLQLTNRKFSFENINIFLDACMSLNPCLDAIPVELHPPLRADLRKILTTLAGIPLSSASIVFPYECLFAVVEK